MRGTLYAFVCYKANTQMRISDVIKFIRENDIDHESWSDEELAVGINNCIHQRGFGYVLDTEGNLKGIYMGKWKDDVTFELFCLVGRGGLKDMLRQFRQRFPQCQKITGMRHVHQKGEVGKYSKELKHKEFELARM